jgi:hypothetical protein
MSIWSPCASTTASAVTEHNSGPLLIILLTFLSSLKAAEMPACECALRSVIGDLRVGAWVDIPTSSRSADIADKQNLAQILQRF